MLSFTIAWTWLLIVCFLLGAAILTKVGGDSFKRVGDRFILSVWLGLILLAVSLLTIALFFPLSPLVGLIITCISFTFPFLIPKVKNEILKIFSFLNYKIIISLVFLELSIAALVSGVITWQDVTYYHFQLIQWFAQVGTVPGLALLFGNYGLSSSWFTVAALFNTGIFESRLAALTGGFILFLATLQVGINLRRIWQKNSQFEDWFIFNFFLICLPLLVWMGIHKSPSPDLPVILIIGVVAWTVLIISKLATSTYKNNILTPHLIILILSFGATTFKLNAIPLAFASFVLYLLLYINSFSKIFLGILISVFFVSPILLTNFVTSGCPLFPSSFMCVDSSWSVGKETAEEISQIVINWSRWQTHDIPQNIHWLQYWIQYSPRRENRIIVFLILSSLLSGFLLLIHPYFRQFSSRYYVLGIALMGVLLMMTKAPDFRFGLGYLGLLPAFRLAGFSRTNFYLMLWELTVTINLSMVLIGWYKLGTTIVILATFSYFLFRVVQLKASARVYLAISLSLIGVIIFKSILIQPQKQVFWLLPPPLFSPQNLESRQVNDFWYFKPKNTYLCGAAQLPCSPRNLTEKSIKLRSPNQGINGGFVRGNRTRQN